MPRNITQSNIGHRCPSSYAKAEAAIATQALGQCALTWCRETLLLHTYVHYTYTYMHTYTTYTSVMRVNTVDTNELPLTSLCQLG